MTMSSTFSNSTHVQEHLRSGGSLDGLLSRYAITSKRHSRYPNLVLLKYNQIASPFAEPIVRECRGIILDETDDWRIVSRAFDKFFNHGEGHAADIDWTTATVQEKVDGSLAVLYPYAGDWHVATSGTPDASGDVHGSGRTFFSLFWDTFKTVTGDRRLPSPAVECCFYFELTSPWNRIVVQHREPGLTLLGARNLRSQLEIPVAHASLMIPGVRVVRSYPLQGWDAISSTFETMSPLGQEGYVVCDARFQRVKVKHPGYVALHHAKDGMGRKAFVQIARSGETSEVLAAFPEYAESVAEARAKVEALAGELEADYARLRDIPEQKAFALEAVKTRCSTALFQVRARKAENIRAFLRDMRIESLLDLLGYDARDEAPAVEAAE